MTHPVYVCGTPYEDRLKSGDMSALDLAPVAAKVGAQGVEYRPAYWRDAEAEIPQAREQLDGLGLRCTYASTATLYSTDPANEASILRDIGHARALGSPLLRVFRGGGDDERGRDGAVKALQAAQDAGVRLALENYVREPGNRLADVAGTLAALSSPVLGANVDIGNYVKNGQDPVEAIETLASRIIYCHFKDVRRAAGGPVATFPGNGFVDLERALAALDLAGADIPFGFEYPADGDPEAAIRAGVEYVRRHGAGDAAS